jgi:carboxypeptidase C (cathepsin A)
MYSGYLNITHTKKALHYVGVMSQNNVTADPIIIWFNGGSGCSSLIGYALEHGPYVVNEGSPNFTENPNAWNKNASVFYIESPAGVGFSLCGDKSECMYNDTN